MKLSLLFIASTLASFTYAQGEGVPKCAIPCVNQFTTGGGSAIAGCNRLDATCICANKNFLSDIACCLTDACNVADQQAATSYARAFCQANQVTDLPTAVSCLTKSTGLPSSTSNAAATITGGSATTSSGAPNAASTSGARTTSAPSPANAAPTNAAGVGAGILGGLAAIVALL